MSAPPEIHSATGLLLTAGSDLPEGELLRLLGAACPCGAFVMEPLTLELVAVNTRLLSLLGFPEDAAPTLPLRLEELLAGDDLRFLKALERPLGPGEELRGAWSPTGQAGAQGPGVAVFQGIEMGGRRLVLGFILAPTKPASEVQELRRLLQQQRARVQEAVNSSLRLYQFNEKLRRTPQLAQRLLDTKSEAELFAEAASILTTEGGLGYRDVTLLLLEEDGFRVAHSTRESTGLIYPLKESGRFSAWVGDSSLRIEVLPGSVTRIVVPLRSSKSLVGLCEVVPHTREKLFFDESGMVAQWQREVLIDIGGILGLVLDNMRLNRQVQRQATLDSLTGAYNRHYFSERLESEILRARRYDRPLSLIFLDLDGFKPVNDRCGHQKGDELLRSIGGLLREELREVDVVCRYGGDEFVLLLPETDQVMADRTAQKILRALRSCPGLTLKLPDRTLSVSASLGFATLADDQDGAGLLATADQAMYEAKQAGGNQARRA